MLKHKERIENCISGVENDRPPVALWRHFPVDDQDPRRLAKATLNYQGNFDFDLVKVTPASSFCLKDWGVEDEWQGYFEGTRKYTKRVIQHPEDWEKLKPLDPRRGALGAQLACLEVIKQALEPDTPVIQTIFSPLAQAKNLVGGAELFFHLRCFPDALHAGLRVISESIARFIAEVEKIGVSGIFYAVQHAQYGLLSEAEYRSFGQRYDLEILNPERNFWLNMLHLHGEDVMFDLFQDYPLQVINWHDRDTAPSLAEGQARFPGVVCGGLRVNTMVLGTPDAILAEARQAREATAGKRFILGTGCVTPITAPYGNLMTARHSLDQAG